MRNKIIESFRAFVGAKGLTKPVKFVKFATLIFKQFALPMEKTNALRYDKDVNFTGQDILNFWTFGQKSEKFRFLESNFRFLDLFN